MTREEIEFQCQLAYDAKLLELIGKNVGDKVKCSFSVSKGDRKHSYTSSIDGEGTIILDEKGYGVLNLMKRISRFKRGTRLPNESQKLPFSLGI